MASSILQDLALASIPWPLQEKQGLAMQMPSFAKPPYLGLAGEVIRELLEVFFKTPDHQEQRYQREVQRIVRDTVGHIREKRAYSFFLDWIRALEASFGLPFIDQVPSFFGTKASLPALLAKTAIAIWVLLEKEGRWPVVVHANQFTRKRIELPQDPEAAFDHLLFVGTQILSVFPLLNQEDLDLMPEQFVGFSTEGSADRIVVPTPVSTVEETLQDAYYNQRYYLHPVGAAVNLHHARDITGALLKVKQGVVIGRFHTLKGDVLCLLDLNTAQGVNVIQVVRDGDPSDFLVRILASVYHALVVANEKSSPHRKRAEEVPLSERYPLAETEEFLSISYIPRTLYIGGKQQVVPPRQEVSRQQREPRPVRPHSSWRGSISEPQRERVREFERATGLNILDRLPPGKTFVLPHFNPAPEPGEKVQLPLFIKKRVEAELIGTSPRVA